MALNTRLRKTLDWRTPAESLMTIYCCSNQAVLRRPLEPEQYTSTETRLAAHAAIAGPRRVLLRPCASRILFAALKNERVHPHSSIRTGIKPNTILPTTLKSSIIGGGSTQRWATGPPHEVRTEYLNEQLAA